MTVSTDAILFYGVTLDEDQEFPWDTEDGIDFEGWYIRNETDWKPFKEIYDENGERLPGVTESDVDRYWDEYNAYAPKDFSLVTHCSDEYPMYGFTVAGFLSPSKITASRGTPEKVQIPDTDWTEFVYNRMKLLDFLDKYNLKHSEFGWWLVSYWG